MKSAWFVLAAIMLATFPAATEAQTTQPSQASTSAPTTLSAQQTMNQLLSPEAGTRPLPPATMGPMVDSTTGKGAVAPGAQSMNVLREGTFIINRVGRLTHSADGQQLEFTFDSDGKTMKDPPMIILPNLKLMQMENAVSSSSRDLHFRVSGMVTEYRGRNYLLLDKVVVVPDVDQQF